MFLLVVMVQMWLDDPIAHQIWHPDGWLFKHGYIDFAGGVVVHVVAAVSALVVCIKLGPREGYDPNVPMSSHSSFLGSNLVCWLLHY